MREDTNSGQGYGVNGHMMWYQVRNTNAQWGASVPMLFPRRNPATGKWEKAKGEIPISAAVSNPGKWWRIDDELPVMATPDDLPLADSGARSTQAQLGSRTAQTAPLSLLARSYGQKRRVPSRCHLRVNGEARRMLLTEAKAHWNVPESATPATMTNYNERTGLITRRLRTHLDNP